MSEVSWNKTYEPLMKLLVHKKGIQTRQAAEVGKKVVTIFRGKEFSEFLSSPSNFANIQRRCPDALADVGVTGNTITADQVKALGDKLIENGFVARSVAKILKIDPTKQGGADGGDSPPNQAPQKRKKWPEKVIRLAPNEQQFEPTSLYIVLYEGSKTWQHVFSFIAIIGVLVAAMFPAWPAWAKIAAWYVVFWLSTAMIVILIVRAILYVCLWTVGIDFWLFPNILDEYAGIVDSFRPLYSVERRRDGYGMTAIRLASMVVIGVATHEFFQHNSWEDIRNFAQNSINDILDWGVDKLTALPQPKNQYLSLADIEKMTEDEKPTTIPGETVRDEVEEADEALFDDMQEF